MGKSKGASTSTRASRVKLSERGQPNKAQHLTAISLRSIFYCGDGLPPSSFCVGDFLQRYPADELLQVA
jgi:hypothetical protein